MSTSESKVLTIYYIVQILSSWITHEQKLTQRKFDTRVNKKKV